MTIKIITREITICDWCGKDSLMGATFESGSFYGKAIHICDSCQNNHDDFEVCHKRNILKDPDIVFEDEEDKDLEATWAAIWGIVEYRKDTGRYHFVKWIQEG